MRVGIYCNLSILVLMDIWVIYIYTYICIYAKIFSIFSLIYTNSLPKQLYKLCSCWWCVGSLCSMTSAKLAGFCLLMLLFLWCFCFYFCFAILVWVYKCVVLYSLWFQLSFLWHSFSIFSRAYWPFRYFFLWSACLILLPTYLLINTFI